MIDSSWLTKKLAVLGIIYGAVISIGASYLSAGISIGYTVPPLIAEYSKHNATQYENSVVTTLSQASSNFFSIGLSIIGLSVLSVILIVYRYEIKNYGKQSRLTSYKATEDGVVSNNNFKYYTGNKYFATRKRLAYHPPDKQFKD